MLLLAMSRLTQARVRLDNAALEAHGLDPMSRQSQQGSRTMDGDLSRKLKERREKLKEQEDKEKNLRIMISNLNKFNKSPRGKVPPGKCKVELDEDQDRPNKRPKLEQQEGERRGAPGHEVDARGRKGNNKVPSKRH